MPIHAKPWFKSRTIWLSVLYIVANVILRVVLPVGFEPAEWAGEAIAVFEALGGIVVMVLNIMLRFKTDKAIV